MPLTIFTGNAGAGKSTMLAQKHIEILNRNVKWFNKSGIIRPIFTNLKLNSDIENAYPEFIKYWKDPIQLIEIKDCDVFIDEIARHFDASQWQNTPLSLKAWIQQHRKLGIEIYGNAQDFGQVDIAIRRLTSKLLFLVKIISNRDPSGTRPPIKYIWGLSVVYSINPTDYQEHQKENKTSFVELFFIRRWKCEIFDTRQIINAGTYPPLNHIERKCIDPDCDYRKVSHA